MPWWMLALLPALALAGSGGGVRESAWTDRYDGLFRKYTKHYFGAHFDWRWFKAQGIAESGLDPDARSPKGASGIMQLLPGTYHEIKTQVPYLAEIEDPRWNIAAGIYYDRQLYRKWKQRYDIRIHERLRFAFGSYNAGYGTMLKAYRKASDELGDIKRWDQMAPYAPVETRRYVSRIDDLMQALD